VASALNSLSGFYAETQKYTKAYPLLIRALKIKETEVGPEHLEVAEIVTKLALMYRGMEDFKKAEPLLVRGLSIYEKHLGAEHVDLEGPLNNLAELYYEMGEYGKSDPLYQRALNIKDLAVKPAKSSDSGAESASKNKRRKTVRLEFAATKDQVLAAIPALAELAEQSEDKKITILIEGKAKKGYDGTWLKNTITLPLIEAGIEELPDDH
jgi:tetratricopeptide (TPR) repeat protein